MLLEVRTNLGVYLNWSVGYLNIYRAKDSTAADYLREAKGKGLKYLKANPQNLWKIQVGRCLAHLLFISTSILDDKG